MRGKQGKVSQASYVLHLHHDLDLALEGLKELWVGPVLGLVDDLDGVLHARGLVNPELDISKVPAKQRKQEEPREIHRRQK